MKKILLLVATLLFSPLSIAKIEVGDTPFDLIGKCSIGEEINQHIREAQMAGTIQ